MLKHDPTSGEINTFMREAALMAPLNHPNVVGLVGVVTAGEPRLIALQFCEHGSLLRCAATEKACSGRFISSNNSF